MAKNIRSLRTSIAKARQFTSLLRLKPFNNSNPEGRARERHRRAALTAIASAAAKAVSILTALITIPLTYRYLGPEQYGLWMTISSVISMLAFADLGIGNGLLNRISEAHGKNDRNAAQQYVSSAFFMLAGLAACLSVVFSLIYPLVNWRAVLNVRSIEAITEGKQAVVVFVACFLLNLPLGVIPRVQLGFQRGFVNSAWLIAGNVFALIGILIAIRSHAGLPWLVLAMAGAPILAYLLNGLVLFGFQERALIPKPARANAAAVRSLFTLGGGFFVLQLCHTIAFASDNLVAAQVLGQEAVAHFSVVTRLFGIVPMLMEMVLTPLWPAYAESFAKGDLQWVRRTLLRTVVFGLLFATVAALVLLFAGDDLLRLWVAAGIPLPFSLLLGFAVWTVLSVIGSSVAMFLNGTGRLKFQIVCGVGLAVMAPVVKVMLSSHFGLSGIVWGTVLAYLVCIALPMAFYVPSLLQEPAKRKGAIGGFPS